ncbi:MAG: Arginine--tRNA ligase [Candidatus Thorarchaeota archaeon AB_25]|nr:MAG: Arginine--tRNA ligase [Candidatus Thorarchaeota archaeon AB_25]
MTKIFTNPWETVRQAVVKMLSEVFSVSQEVVAESIEKPPDSALGDLASTIAFSLSKELKKNPVEVVNAVLSKLESLADKEPMIKEIKTKGPYINIFFDHGKLAELIVGSVLEMGDSYGRSQEFKGQRALIESPAVNPSKPWHIGHARNAILGDTLCNILDWVGYDAVRLDYVNDLGLQIAQLIWKLLQVEDNGGDEKYDHYLGHLYVEGQEAFDNNDSVQEAVREVSRKLEDFESKEAKLSAKMVTKCLNAQNETSYRLGIYHDYQAWESTIAHSGLLELAQKMMLKSDNILKLDEGEKAGCIVADLSVIDEFKDLKDPYKVLFRSDGTRTYTGADVAFQLWKFGIIEDPFKYSLFENQPNGKPVMRTDLQGQKVDLGKFDIVMNVIGSRQAHPQKLVYTILDILGYSKESENSHHIAYEFVGLEDVDFSGRHGTWIGYSTDDVLDKATELARVEVEKRNPDEDDTFKDKVANQVSVGAVRYFMLNASPDRQITFRWNEALDFNGDAAPYLQYSHARAQRILEKAEDEITSKIDLTLLSTDTEFELVKAIAQLPEELLEVVRSLKKSVWGTSFTSNRITAYTYSLANLFSKFYDSCPVLKAEPDVKASRLALVRAFKTSMANCLTVLGIPVVDRM